MTPSDNAPNPHPAWWPCAITGLLILLVLCVSILKMPAALAWDFHLFYAAGKVPASLLYNEQAQENAQRQIWEANLRGLREFNFSPFLKPAYYRILLVPLSRLPFWRAYAAWGIVQWLAFVVAIILLSRRYGYQAVWYIPLPLCPYVVISISWGQDTPVVFLLLVLTLELLLRRRDGSAGALLALGLVKWNILMFLPLLFLVQKKWKALAAFSAIAAAEVAISIWITGAAGIRDYRAMLGGDYADFLAVGMPSLRGLLLLAHIPNAVVLALIPLAGGAVLRMLWKLEMEKAFAMATAASVFLAYHTMIYDLLFLILPILVFQRELRAGWKAAVTVLFLSPIPNLAGKLALACTFLVLLICFRQAGRPQRLAVAEIRGGRRPFQT